MRVSDEHQSFHPARSYAGPFMATFVETGTLLPWCDVGYLVAIGLKADVPPTANRRE